MALSERERERARERERKRGREREKERVKCPVRGISIKIEEFKMSTLF